MSIEGIRKVYHFCQNCYIKWLGVRPRGGASPYKTFLRTPPPPPGKKHATLNQSDIGLGIAGVNRSNRDKTISAVFRI